ncbi:peptide arginase family protein [Peptostreptococcus faecalis]|uniref:UPF0489 family protein n=1 Tax=Peptostreptococcus faecalis TaxID=2045015 RepID=UPI000C7AE0C2|nr:UPF0489 family protein [Peptostreptococcus faecalis]
MEYGGFYIEKPVGNNSFSFDERKNKKIYVPQLINGSFNDIEIGNEATFIEVEDSNEFECIGLKNMYKIVDDNIGIEKDIYVFDNHNHAFFFWCKSLKEGRLKKGAALLHVDQHKDTREPSNYDVDIEDIEDVKRYTNEILNVGSFIKPALYHNIFSTLQIVDSNYGLDQEIPKEYVLDIDLDFFSEDMDYIDFDKKRNKISEYIKGAKVITIASSPFFIDQKRAIETLKILFDVEI